MKVFRSINKLISTMSSSPELCAMYGMELQHNGRVCIGRINLCVEHNAKVAVTDNMIFIDNGADMITLWRHRMEFHIYNKQNIKR